MIENLWRGIAIISASEDGFKAGEIVKEKLKRFEIPVVHFKYKDADIETVWRCYDAIIFVMALEGATRIICKYAKSKTKDPAIICIDDKINYVIPLLGGHWGANDIARDLSVILNSTPIITTAAELKGKLSVEKIANILVAKILNPENIVKINAVLLRDEYVCVDGVDINVTFPENIRINSEECNYIVSLRNDKEYKDKIVVWLKPLKISIGVGSKKDVKIDEIRDGIYKVLERLNLKRERIGIIASIREEVKKIADEINVKFRLVNEEEINNFTNPCLTPPSKTLIEVGLKGVAEISALIAGGINSKLILRKIAISRNSTIAVATYEGE
ncbi:cobalamin (vitamin B12) biosynthesis CbiG protein [Sulfolobus islandicus Y.G.57.14]|jgi:cobalt-precorrin 5A hydrolase|uniref:Cobalamin (Vitamin B12) biosynthesis CbiG protein n=3 Tax=Saccharolobus islandicus TaxID=43080 RepID=C3MJI2_SACI2|nr:cobalt-precorrin 5A hydrolase [Sulfolobus islandicus]ACP34260.1 cobalamin (vitamin B12) biosynthesis CbiG protein [Sulfolobus islandicus L.S.2.15]ACP44403.1 cobalamin (vitamin B12) biosynthesis CbiG protein [Sulfolobus islandicus Y.G.57.14]ACP47304.1 cobalamin (vitamin B12) biosynthesis CbiG protein [Sulfolobus islandicus Y.N.15.51]PVU78313.1 cobalt-precorrin 5A hydrolase [Sulfolobus islandicus]